MNPQAKNYVQTLAHQIYKLNFMMNKDTRIQSGKGMSQHEILREESYEDFQKLKEAHHNLEKIHAELVVNYGKANQELMELRHQEVAEISLDDLLLTDRENVQALRANRGPIAVRASAPSQERVLSSTRVHSSSFTSGVPL